MEKFKSYTIEKQNLLKKLELLQLRLSELKKFDIDCNDVAIKISETVEAIQNDVISIVLVGSFSDGKTSVIAGWLGEECKNMKIDRDESSDRREIYHPTNIPEKCEIIDTPGLFGDKECTNETGEVFQLSEITKHYVDQANIILYVVEAKNPIKESHREVIKWILKDLNKLDNTIFVINKMDSVVDVTDLDSFNKMSLVKIGTLKEKICDIISLSPEQSNNLKIVTLSSDPGERGFQFWSEHRDKYEERSHINELEKVTNEIITIQSETLVNKTGYDVLCRILSDKIVLVNQQLDLLVNEYIPTIKESIKRNQDDIQNARKQILKNRTKFEMELLNYENQLLSEINAITPDSIKNFITDTIGIENGELGYRIEQKINILSEEFMSSTSMQLVNLYKKLQSDYENRNEFLDSIAKKTATSASTALKAVGRVPLNQMKDAVFAGRNLLSKIGVVIKFKPWGATKLASGILKGFPMFGVGIDFIMNGIETWQQNKQQQDFLKMRDELKEFIMEFFKCIMDQITDDEQFLLKFAPQLYEIQNQVNTEVREMEKFIDEQRNLEIWKKETSNIMAIPL